MKKILLLAVIQFSEKWLTGKTQNFPKILRIKSLVLPEIGGDFAQGMLRSQK